MESQCQPNFDHSSKTYIQLIHCVMYNTLQHTQQYKIYCATLIAIQFTTHIAIQNAVYNKLGNTQYITTQTQTKAKQIHYRRQNMQYT